MMNPFYHRIEKIERTEINMFLYNKIKIVINLFLFHILPERREMYGSDEKNSLCRCKRGMC